MKLINKFESSIRAQSKWNGDLPVPVSSLHVKLHIWKATKSSKLMNKFKISIRTQSKWNRDLPVPEALLHAKLYMLVQPEQLKKT